MKEITDEFNLMYREISRYFTGNSLTILIIEFLILVIVGIAGNILHIFAAIGLGQLFKQHKIAGSLAMYIGIYMAKNFISTFFIAFLSTSESANNINQTGEIPRAYISNFAHLSLGLGLILQIVLCAALYLLGNYMFKTKLNLE